MKSSAKTAPAASPTGRLIVIEGASDGIGKTTQYKLLLEKLQHDLGRSHVASHHFPTYYAYQGKGVEKYLSGDYGTPEELSPYFINNLFAYDRMITWQTKLKAKFERGQTLLLDRYTTSSMIYQTALLESRQEKTKLLDYIADFEFNKLGIKRPDQVIFLHAPIELVNQMRSARTSNEGDIKGDVYESNLELLRKVYDNAMFVADYFHWTKIDCATPSGDQILPIETIHAKIYQVIQEGK